jgi:L-lactate dehydrogenase complex protein LldG
VGVRQNDRIKVPWIDRKRLPIALLELTRTLEETAIYKNLLPVGLDQVLGSGDRLSGSVAGEAVCHKDEYGGCLTQPTRKLHFRSMHTYNMSDRDTILANLRHGRMDNARLLKECGTYHSDIEASWELFNERLSELGGHVVLLSGDPLGVSLLRHLDDLGLPARTAILDADAAVLLKLEPTADVWSADVGITLAELAVAETGSVFIEAGPARARLISLAPPVHVVVVRDDQLVGSLEDAFQRDLTRTSVLITGPSRTADIEGVLVRGVHGPKHVVVARISS